MSSITQELNMQMAAVSQHLRKLKDGGLTLSNKIGQEVFYSVSPNKSMLISTIMWLINNSTDNKKLGWKVK